VSGAGSRRGRRGDDPAGPVPFQQSLGQVADRLGAGRVEAVTAVFGRWEELVGPAMAAHVRPVRIDGGTLIVTVDHPAWATQLRHLSADLLARLSAAIGAGASLDRLDIRIRPAADADPSRRPPNEPG